MKSILIEATLWTDKDVLKEATSVFTELNSIKEAHSLGGLIKAMNVS